MDVASRLNELALHYSLPSDAERRLGLLLELVEVAPISITAVREPARAVETHVADSLSGLLVPALRDAPSVADLGSGGGFPGLVLAAALPGTTVTLVESVMKKASFLEAVAGELALPNVVVVAQRAEDWTAGRLSQGVVTARALAPLTALVEYAAPLLADRGSLVAWKGPGADLELADAEAAGDLLGMSAPEAVLVPPGLVGGADGRRLYVSSKVSATPPGYPRRAGMARKRPIRASSRA